LITGTTRLSTFKPAVAEKPAAKIMIRTRVLKRHPEGDW
jgi:hypothetical protein